MFEKRFLDKVDEKLPIFALNPRKKTMQVMGIVEDFLYL
tara:strand:- start:9621 stop:9737 length:117 start_codon:yes stop_codon:yes gene_type:complete